jgi:WD40 repeat protein
MSDQQSQKSIRPRLIRVAAVVVVFAALVFALQGMLYQRTYVRHTLRGHGDAVFGIAYSPDGRVVATSSTDGDVRVWDTTNGQLVKKFPGHKESVHQLAFSGTGERLVTAGWDNLVRFWDLKSGTEETQVSGFCIAVSPDGGRLAVGNYYGFIELRSLDRLERQGFFRAHERGIAAIAFSPDGRWLATGSADSTAKVWNAETFELQCEIRWHTRQVWSLAFSQDGATLATASDDGRAALWNVETGTMRNHLRSQDAHDLLYSVAYSRDGTVVAVGGMGSRETWLQQNPLTAPFVTASRPDGGVAILFDAATGKEIMTLEHPRQVTQVRFGAKRNQLATGSADNLVKIWSIGETDLP